MPDAPAPTPVLSMTTTSGVSPAAACSLARCQALDSPWMPAPITRYLAEDGSDIGAHPFYCLCGNGISLVDLPIVAQRRGDRTRAREQQRQRRIALLAPEPPGRALHAQDRRQEPAGAEHGSREGVQVVLALLHR